MNTTPTLNVAGAGRAGRTLGRLWHEADVFRINDVVCRDIANAGDACRFMGAGRPVAAIGEMTPATVTLFAVPDSLISDCGKQAAVAGVFAGGAVAVHLSGALASTELAVARSHGAFLASAHPVKSFADPARAVTDFDGTWCGVEGDEQALTVINAALERIGARPFHIDPSRKARYHAACVLGSNYIVTLLDTARRTLIDAGVDSDTAAAVIDSIARTTLGNVDALGPERALTGPIRRGDAATVRRNLEAMGNRGDAELYRAMGLATLALAVRAPDWQVAHESALESCLKDKRNTGS